MKALISSLLMLIFISAIAVFYQLHLTKISGTINYYSNNIIQSTNDKDLLAVKESIDKLNIIWAKNKTMLMIFHDHASVNTASSFLSLANNALDNNDCNRVSADIIQFAAIISELAAENIPSLENIL